MNNEYLHLTLHHQHVHEALQRSEHRHIDEVPEPRRRLPGLILDLVRPRQRRVVAVRRATMAA
ncbi:hypothetical protein [Granulicoccus sp. GXG6511]|uniref:hypothetical protein n=1 Tax=Granulicoccus sp. GXG6511 TaxID=3381351 RepID=UPI003D7DC385